MTIIAMVLAVFFLPTIIYYLIGLWCLAKARRNPYLAVIWALSFLAMFAYTFHESVYLKPQFESRGQAFREPVAFAPPPADVSALLVYRDGPYSHLTGNGQECATVCVKTLLDGRFKEFIIGFKEPALFRYPAETLTKSERELNREPLYYKVYTLVEQTGCKTETDIGMVGITEPLQVTGRCFREIRRNHLEGRYFELTTGDDVPDAPPWKVTANHVRLWDNGKSQDIARVEHAEVDLAYWFPLPGIFPHGTRGGFPSDFNLDFYRVRVSYGPFNDPIKTLQAVFGLPLDKDLLLPKTSVPATSAIVSAPSFNCTTPWQLARKVAPRSEGPLKLAASYCFPANSGPMNVGSDPIVSPDGRSIAFINRPTTLRVFTFESGKSTDYPVRTKPVQIEPAAIAWDSSSNFLWAGSQQRRPFQPSPTSSTFWLEALEPVATAEPGAIRTIPPQWPKELARVSDKRAAVSLGNNAFSVVDIEHRLPGGTDTMPLQRAKEMLWAGDGLAVVNLDSKAFAIIDVEQGTLIDTLTFTAIDAISGKHESKPANYSLNSNVAAVRLPDGRVRVLIRNGQWVVWTQGEKPRVLADPYPDDKKVWLVMSPRESQVLVARQLKDLEPVVCRSPKSGRCGSSPAPNAVLAALHNLDTGKAIWTVLERPKTKLEFPRPAISPDGRFALIAFPAGDVAAAAVVGMEDGKVRQELPGGAFGFTRGGRAAWIFNAGVTAFYDVTED